MDAKKVRPGVAAPERANGTAACGAAYSETDCTASAGRISSLLLSGRSNAVPLAQLCSLTGLDGRTVRQMIAAERLHGVPVLSDNSSGYFLPGDEIERAQFVRSMRHRAGEILRVADAVAGQEIMGGCERGTWFCIPAVTLCRYPQSARRGTAENV